MRIRLLRPRLRLGQRQGQCKGRLYDYDRIVDDNKSNGLCSWGWTTKKQLLKAICSNAACSRKFFLLSGAMPEHEACSVCGAKNTFKNEFEFTLTDKARFPAGLSEALVKAAKHINHGEENAAKKEKATKEAKAAKKAKEASAAASSSEPPPAKRSRT